MAASESTGTSESPPPARVMFTRLSPRQPGDANSRQPFAPVPVDQSDESLFLAGLRNAPPWLISAIVHMIAMIVLALLLLPQMFNDQVNLEATFADSLGEQLLIDSPLSNVFTDDTTEPILTPDDLLEVLKPAAEPSKIDVESLVGFDVSSDPVLAMVGIAYDGRRPGTKESLLGAYGGNALTQQAVLAGLEWLARNQEKNGSWSLMGPYSDGAVRENREVATAMALLAFQGDGNTTEYGEYKEVVKRGWYYLLKRQDAKGCFYRERHRIHHLYTQGLATIAVCELYAMTSDPMLRRSYREPAIKAVDYCVQSQSSAGGWRYVPRRDSDLSVTGWILMALQSARMAGLEVPGATLDQASGFLDNVGNEGGSRYRYHPGKSLTRAMTAEGLLCRQYLGWKQDHPALIEGVDWLLEPENQLSYQRDRDVYYWYYATQVMHHMEGEPWQKWNARMCEAVPPAQVKEGVESGSWDPQKPTADRRAEEGGRLYVTCLSLYMLQVYYRHLPLYANPFQHLK